MFYKRFAIFTSEFCFWVNLETCQFVFDVANISKFVIILSDFIKIHFIIRDLFKKMFLMKSYHSSVYFCYLKCGTCVFGKPKNSCITSCSGIAVFLVIFSTESDSLINYGAIF